MGVFNQNYGGLGWGMDGVVVGRHAVQSQEVMVGCQEIPEHLLYTGCRKAASNDIV